MELETAFYILGIAFMTIMIIFMLIIILIVLYIKRRIMDLEKNIKKKVELASAFKNVGGKAAEIAFDRIKDMIKEKKKS